MSEPCFVAAHAVLIPSKCSSDRARGHPAIPDCSGNAGIVVAGLDGVVKIGFRVVVVAESGSGRLREEGKRMQRRRVIIRHGSLSCSDMVV